MLGPGSGRAGRKPTKKPTARGGGSNSRRPLGASAYFCHVRFLWRFAFKRFRRLCLFIFKRRFFFRLPMVGKIRDAVRKGFGPNVTRGPGGCKAYFNRPQFARGALPG